MRGVSMISLRYFKKYNQSSQAKRRVGRGLGSGTGKTCGRGEKGAGSRSGYKRRYGYEGGQFRMFMKMPIRGFSAMPALQTQYETVNLGQIERRPLKMAKLSISKALIERGFLRRHLPMVIKILGNGELTKKVTLS